MVKYVDVLLSELFGSERVNADKGFEHELYAILLSQVKIGRLAGCGLGLRNENLLNFQDCTVLIQLIDLSKRTSIKTIGIIWSAQRYKINPNNVHLFLNKAVFIM